MSSFVFAGGAGGYTAFLAGQYEQGMAILSPFLVENPHLMENFMVHCVFSDSFKQFSRYMNEPLTVSDLIRHECALLTAWYWFFTVRLAQSALQYGKMNEELFLQTAIDSSRSWWHYPDWFARCADRMDQSFDGLKSIILSLDPAQI